MPRYISYFIHTFDSTYVHHVRCYDELLLHDVQTHDLDSQQGLVRVFVSSSTTRSSRKRKPHLCDDDMKYIAGDDRRSWAIVRDPPGTFEDLRLAITTLSNVATLLRSLPPCSKPATIARYAGFKAVGPIESTGFKVASRKATVASASRTACATAPVAGYKVALLGAAGGIGQYVFISVHIFVFHHPRMPLTHADHSALCCTGHSPCCSR